MAAQLANRSKGRDPKLAAISLTDASSCRDLSRLSNAEISGAEDLNDDSSLCGICRRIRLKCLVEGHDHVQIHYHLGRINEILKKTTCALCRLISSVYFSTKIEQAGVDSRDQLDCNLYTKWVRGASYANPKLFQRDDEDFNYVDVFAIHCVFSSAQGFSQHGTHIIQIHQDEIDSIVPSGCRHRHPSVGRTLAADQVDFGLVKHWLELCESSHEEACGQRIDQKGAEVGYDIRLIDVQDCCIVKRSTNDRYLALSYVWGGDQQMTLSQQNYARLTALKGLNRQDLPRIIAGALSAAEQMGERYLWVDRLCIVEDDEHDVMEQLSIMGRIYANATLTIIAACATSANMPLCGVEQDTRSTVQHSEIIDGARYITGQPDPITSLSDANWRTRGWTFQESFLSTRCLIFTTYQVYFQCGSASWCEDSCLEGRLKPTPTLGNGLCDMDSVNDADMSDVVDVGHQFHIRKQCAFKRYTGTVENYSGRTLAKDSDALWAFDGVTKALESEFRQGFAWGMPISNMDAALLWYPAEWRDTPRGGTHRFVKNSHIVDVPFPSWSWLSRRGRVKHVSNCEEEVQGLVEWHQPLTYIMDPISAKWRVMPGSDDKTETVEKHTHQSSSGSLSEHQLGLLYFTALSAHFELVPTGDFADDPAEDCTYCPYVFCNILTPVKENIGSILVPKSWLRKSTCSTCMHRMGEFILLSMRIKNPLESRFRDSDRPITMASVPERSQEQPTCHIMLIDWKNGEMEQVATRVGITEIRFADWLRTPSVEQTIVLN